VHTCAESEQAVAQALPKTRFEFPGLIIDMNSRQVWREGKEVALTLTEFNLLSLLASQAGQVVSRGELLRKVWGYEVEIETRTVDAHVYRLRKKIERDSRSRITFTRSRASATASSPSIAAGEPTVKAAAIPPIARTSVDGVWCETGKRAYHLGADGQAYRARRSDTRGLHRGRGLSGGRPIDEYAGALLQVGGTPSSASAGPIGSPGGLSLTAGRITARFVELRAGLPHGSIGHGRNSETADGEEPDVRLVEADDSAVPRHDSSTWTTLGPAPPASGKTRPLAQVQGAVGVNLPAAVLDDATEVRIAC